MIRRVFALKNVIINNGACANARHRAFLLLKSQIFLSLKSVILHESVYFCSAGHLMRPHGTQKVKPRAAHTHVVAKTLKGSRPRSTSSRSQLAAERVREPLNWVTNQYHRHDISFSLSNTAFVVIRQNGSRESFYNLSLLGEIVVQRAR